MEHKLATVIMQVLDLIAPIVGGGGFEGLMYFMLIFAFVLWLIAYPRKAR